jgi:hypothetical protein
MQIPDGLCHCGCGNKTSISQKTDPRFGWIKGVAKSFVHGHNRRLRERYSIDETSGCWEWLLAKDRDGYGWDNIYVSRRQRHKKAHHVYWEKLHGPIPKGMQLDHLCRNPRCVNPDHLELVTPTENLRRGNSTKLDVVQVRQIRQELDNGGFIPVIANKFQISEGNIYHIKKMETWKDV